MLTAGRKEGCERTDRPSRYLFLPNYDSIIRAIVEVGAVMAKFGTPQARASDQLRFLSFEFLLACWNSSRC
jgi:hypothetical protein